MVSSSVAAQRSGVIILLGILGHDAVSPVTCPLTQIYRLIESLIELRLENHLKIGAQQTFKVNSLGH